MKKFKFSLETVLSYKDQVLDSIRNEYAVLQAQVAEQEAVLEAIQAHYQAYNEEFRTRKAEGMSIIDAITYENGLRVLEKDIQRETQRLEEYRKQAEEKSEEMVEAKKETASLEKLREKKLDAYEKTIQKSEEQFIEEFVSSTRAAVTGA